jgi:hypothetical protein
MTQKTNKKILVTIPILAAILVGSFGFSNAFAEKSPQTGDILAFTAETQGWAVINGEALPAGISFTGNATMQNSGVWTLESKALVDYNSGTGEVDLKGKANPQNGRIGLTGSGTSEDGIDFRLILRGNYAPIFEQENKFALDWKFSKIHVPQNGIKILLLQDGIIETIQN